MKISCPQNCCIRSCSHKSLEKTNLQACVSAGQWFLGDGWGERGACSSGHPVVMDRCHSRQHPRRDAVLVVQGAIGQQGAGGLCIISYNWM